MKRNTTNRILLISYNFSPELTGIGKYNGEMVNWLVKSGYDCSVLTAYPYYPSWNIREPYRRKRFGYSYEEKQVDGCAGSVKIYRCPIYVPAKPTPLKRILLDLSFFVSAFLRLLPLLFRPRFDFVIAVSPSFQVGLLGVFYKQIKRAKLIYHIQDLQIEAARDLRMIKSDALVNTLMKAEDHVLHQADMVSSISEEMVGRVFRRMEKNAFLFPNWTNVDFFFPRTDRDVIKRSYGFSPDDIIALYSGAMGEKQGLESILHAASSFRPDPRLKFILCGNGPYAEKLKGMARDLSLENIFFLSLQPLEKFNEFLNIADIHLVIQKAGASDLVMPSKLGAILAVGGTALVTANPGSSLFNLIQKHDMGFLVNAEDQSALEYGIAVLSSGDFRHLSVNARRYAVDYLSVDKVMLSFENRLRRLWRGKSDPEGVVPRHDVTSAFVVDK